MATRKARGNRSSESPLRMRMPPLYLFYLYLKAFLYSVFCIPVANTLNSVRKRMKNLFHGHSFGPSIYPALAYHDTIRTIQPHITLTSWRGHSASKSEPTASEGTGFCPRGGPFGWKFLHRYLAPNAVEKWNKQDLGEEVEVWWMGNQLKMRKEQQ